MPAFKTRLRAAWAGWIASQDGRFALWLPVCAMAGDAAFFGLRHDPPVWLGALVLLAGAGCLASRTRPGLHAVALAVGFAGFGFGSAQLAAWRAGPLIALPSHVAAVAGRLVEAEALPDGQRWLLAGVQVDGAAIGPRRLRLKVDATADAAPGDSVSLRAMVAPPSPPAYPGGRDLQRDAYFGRLAGYGYALGAPGVVHAAAPGYGPRLRARIAGRIRAVLPGGVGEIAAALLTGLAADIPPTDRAAFRDAGLAHLLAIAGLHIGIVMGLVLAATRAALLVSERAALFWPVRQIAAIASLAAGLFYLLLTGMHVPLLRAFTMGALIVLGLLSGRRAVSLRSWGLAAVAVIAAEPAEITGASFQLSFAAVLALIAGYEVLRDPLTRLRGTTRARRLLHHLATLALTSLLAGAASIPFIAYHFGRIQVYFVLANLVAVPITALLIMPAGLMALALMPFGFDRIALIPMGWGVDAVLRLAHAVAVWPGATIGVKPIPMTALLIMAAGLAWLCLWRGRARLAGVPIMAAGCVLATLFRPPDVLVAADGRLAGVRGREALLVRAVRGGDGYEAAQWSQWLASPVRPACDQKSCIIAAAAGGRVGLGDTDSLCTDLAALVVQQGAAPFCPGIPTLDRGDSWDDGAWAIWLPSGRMLSDRQSRGTRPWVFLPPEQRRATLRLPFAPTETLP